MRCVCLMLVFLLLSRCIASNQVRLDSPVSSPPDYQLACRYSWPASVSGFRSLGAGGIANPGWAYHSQGQAWNDTDEQRLGEWLAALIIRDLNGCDSAPENRIPVEIYLYYGNYDLPPNVTRALFDVVTVLGTLGTVPVDESDGYLLCLDIVSGDTVVRHALVTGRIKVELNMWGIGKQEARAHAAVSRMLQELAESAWHSLWLNPAPPGTLGPDCATELSAS